MFFFYSKDVLLLLSKYLYMEFSSNDVAAMRLFYEDEKTRYTAHLKHINKILNKLRSNELDDEQGIVFTKTGDKAKKRGPKSVWGKFILDELQQANSPLSYKMLVNKALEFRNLDFNSSGIIRSSILNSAFRLRSIHGKVATVGQLGKKEKFLILTSWLDESGALSKKHQGTFTKIAGGTPELVDMTKLPQPRYDEDLNLL